MQKTVTQVLEEILKIAERNKDEDLKKWVYLELEGYISSNLYPTEDVIVPEYRRVAGQHKDSQGRILRFDSELSFVNEIPLRQSVPELENIQKRGMKSLTVRVDYAVDALSKIGVNADSFSFDGSQIDGVLNSIKQEALRRASKYTTLENLIAERNSKSPNLPEKNSIAWLRDNIPAQWWVGLFAAFFAVFIFGVTAGGIPQIEPFLKYLPGYRSKIVPEETRTQFEKLLTSLIEAHSARLSKMQEQLLEQEKLAAAEQFIADRNHHLEASARIQDHITQENKTFSDESDKMKSLLK